MKPVVLMGIASILTGCAHTADPLTKPGREVTIVTTLSPSEMPQMSDLGEVAVKESWPFDGDEQDAKLQMRNYAARDGADIVLLQQEGRQPCEVDSHKDCVFVRGRKLRRAESGARPSEVL
jgi:hypothetical protein